jgi:hypothetical protein
MTTKPKPYLAKSLVRLTAERNTRWARLRKLIRWQQDAWLGDAAHKARPSGHNPDYRGCVHAKDFDVRGMHVPKFLDRVIGDPRVWYVIFDGHIYSRTHHWDKRKYDGADPHTEHVHVSILNNQEGTTFHPRELAFAENTTTGWGIASLVHPGMLLQIRPIIARKVDGRA